MMPWLLALAVFALVATATFVSWFDGQVTDGYADQLPIWMFDWAMRADRVSAILLGAAIGIALAWALQMAGVA